MPAPLSRRSLIALSAAAAVAQFGLPKSAAAEGPESPTAGGAQSPAADGREAAPAQDRGAARGRGGPVADKRLAQPVDHAYRYLDAVMDAYGQGTDLRLLQSYNNESGLMTAAFIYDNALATIAYLSRPTRENVSRARIIGDTLLWIQANDETYSDGRVRQAYAAGPMVFYGWWPEFPGLARPDGKAAFLWPFGFSGSSVGDMAWAAIALAQLHAHTGRRKYLDGAVALGEWIKEQVSPYRHGGYHGGVQADGTTPQPWSSTEHNIDVYALFRMLGWKRAARAARDFVRSMWNPDGGHYFTGTHQNDLNVSVKPEDVNTWAFLSLGDRRFASAIDWTATHLANTDAATGIKGVTFSDLSKVLEGPVPGTELPNDRTAVWLEGNGHMACALLARHNGGDRHRAVGYLLETVKAQRLLGGGQTVGLTSDTNGGRLSNPGEGGNWTGSPLPAQSGIVAATNAFDTGFGFGYFPNQHVGATSWFLMAAHGVNPYKPIRAKGI